MARVKVAEGIYITYETMGGEETDDLHIKIGIEADPDSLKDNIFLVFHKIASIISRARGGGK